jgi:hypothetical protein
MPMPRLLERVNFQKLVTILAVIFGIAAGACGLTAIASNTKLGEYLLPLGLIELAVMVLSAVALVAVVVVLIIVLAIGDRGGSRSATVRLFDDSDKDKPAS